MSYIIIEIQKNEGGNLSHIVKTAETRRGAESIYHGMLMYAAKSDLPVHTAAILDETGICLDHESYEREDTSNEQASDK